MSLPRVAVGIDLATKCGWAVLLWETGERLDSGIWDCSIRRGEGPGFRTIRLHNYLTELLKAYGDSAWGYEWVRKHQVKGRTNTVAAQLYGGLREKLFWFLDSAGTPYAGVEVPVIKKEATGKGNAGKPAMVAAANARWGLELAEDQNDEADALWIAECLRQGRTS